MSDVEAFAIVYEWLSTHGCTCVSISSATLSAAAALQARRAAREAHRLLALLSPEEETSDA